ncbi:uncharacterized protein LOC110990748 isoform X1 [Acanthaster planci]|uniref:Uncharacterized protein LOC110990748 isoform X1 n=1 Tax=Acanthaster planci TaxID=133434 RepID=A0A8B8A1B1_ACAPL|nr:uncharacterized protein LOC110990748 isoform X1 [Acanthaster planci]
MELLEDLAEGGSPIPDYSSIHGFLRKWGVEQLLGLFEEHKIDLEVLPLLDEQTVTELIPQIGVRMKFLNGWRREFQQDKQEPTLRHADSFSTLDIDEVCNTSTCTSRSTSIVMPCSRPDTGSVSSMSSVCTPQPPKKKCRVQAIDARAILQTTVAGRDIITHLEKNKCLTKTYRCKMTALLVGHLIDNYGLKPCAYEKQALAESIIRDFPFLKDPEGTGYDAWYTKGAAKRPATGYLEERLRYVRKTMLKVETSPSAESLSSDKDSPERSQDEEEDIAGMTSWLQENSEPEHKVRDYMAKTAGHRQQLIHQKKVPLAEILQQYPRILDAAMILQDFDLGCYSDAADKLLEKWGQLSDHIILYASVMNSAWKELIGMPHLDSSILSAEEKSHLALYLLAFLLGGRARGGRRGGRFAINMESFIDLQPAVTNVAEYLNSIKSSERPQPYILALVTTNRLLPTQSFLIIERKAIEMPSLLKTVDLAFKSHYVFNVTYQPQVQNVWDFLQCVVYELPGLARPIVRDMRAFLRRQLSTQA